MTTPGLQRASLMPGTADFALMLGVVGVCRASGGAWLMTLGGATYYLIAGIACLIAGALYPGATGGVSERNGPRL